MSAHYSTRQSSGCLGCAAVIIIAIGAPVVIGVVCWEFVSWFASM